MRRLFCPYDPLVLIPHASHVNALFFSIDGNFRAVLKKKRHDPDDKPLLDGRSYFVSTAKYDNYVSTAPTDPTEVRSRASPFIIIINELQHKSSCTNLRSMRLVTNRKGVEVTGIIATVCARHSFFVANSMVNMTLGEKYVCCLLRFSQLIRCQGLHYLTSL